MSGRTQHVELSQAEINRMTVEMVVEITPSKRVVLILISPKRHIFLFHWPYKNEYHHCKQLLSSLMDEYNGIFGVVTVLSVLDASYG